MPNTRQGTSREDTPNQEEQETLTMKGLLQLLRNLQGTHTDKGNLQFEKFKEEEETFTTYVERLNNFFELKNVVNEKKSLVLLNSLDTRHYQLIADITSPELSKTKSYEKF